MSRRSDLPHLINDIMKNQKTITKEMNKLTKEIKEIQENIDIFERSLHELDKRIEENNVPDFMLDLHAKVKNSTTATLLQHKEQQSNLILALTRYNAEATQLDTELTRLTVLFAQQSLSTEYRPRVHGSRKYKSNSRGGRKRKTRKNKNK
jgi:septation ring formation regulator EzrA